MFGSISQEGHQNFSQILTRKNKQAGIQIQDANTSRIIKQPETSSRSDLCLN